MSSPEAAEMTKLLENIYRGVNIALVNELKQLCFAMGIDIWEVIEAASTKPFGFAALLPRAGHRRPLHPGGPLLPELAREAIRPTRQSFIELAGEVNEAMPGFVVQTVQKVLGGLAGKRILLLGVAYKRDVDDLRESPALTLFSLLQSAGADVRYNDPYFPQVGSGRHYAVNQASTPLDCHRRVRRRGAGDGSLGL
jgi:UDP-N-acetyl-D-glucosamine dehydrogenase